MTYRAVLRNREFAALLASQGLSVAGDQLARIAVAVLVFDRTGSAFTASATYAVSYLTYLVGGPWLSAISDRRPRVAVMVTTDLIRVPLVLLLCISGLPTWVLFLVLGLVGALAPPFDSARGALQPDLLEGDEYVLGNGIIQIVAQLAQVLGFGLGGVLVSTTSARSALVMDAATFLVSAGILLANVRQRPSAQPPENKGSIWNDTRAGARLVGGDPLLRRLLFFAVLGSAAVIGPEGLAVPVAHALGHGALTAGVLTASIPLGFLVASTLLLRVPTDRRLPLLPWLTLLGCLPLLATPLVNSVTAVMVLWVIAGAGGSVNIIAGAAFMQNCPRDYRSRAYGLAVTSLYAAQGAALLIAGALTGPLGSRGSVAALAALSLLALALAQSSRAPRSQGVPDVYR